MQIYVNAASVSNAPQRPGKSAIFSPLKTEGEGSSQILGKLKLKIANIIESGLLISSILL